MLPSFLRMKRRERDVVAEKARRGVPCSDQKAYALRLDFDQIAGLVKILATAAL